MEIDSHTLLVKHLEAILEDAKNGEFHDFKNEKYPTPKVELVLQLNRIIENVKQGLYDNL